MGVIEMNGRDRHMRRSYATASTPASGSLSTPAAARGAVLEHELHHAAKLLARQLM